MEDGLGLARLAGDDAGAAQLLASLAMVAQYRGDYTRAAALADEGMAVGERSGDTHALGRNVNARGLVAYALGDWERAWTAQEQVAALQPGVRIISLIYMARIAYARGDDDSAVALLGECLSTPEGQHNPRNLGWALELLGEVACRRGDYPRALALLRDSMAPLRRIGQARGMIHCLDRLARVLSLAGSPALAARLFASADAARTRIDATIYPSERIEYERDVAATRERLGDEAFAVAWEQGRTLSLEEAIGAALDAAGKLLEPAPAITVMPTPLRAAPVSAARNAPDVATAPLSAREQEVATLLARGLTNRQIAAELIISERTAGSHVAHILDKLGFTTRAQIAAWAVEHRLTRQVPARPDA